jgi:hypothetical protein
LRQLFLIVTTLSQNFNRNIRRILSAPKKEAGCLRLMVC